MIRSIHGSVRRLGVAGAALGLALSVCGPASAATATGGSATALANAPVTVQLTVTGPDGTVYDGDIETTGHTITVPTGGTHVCDGTNNGANPEPGATPTAALDDAATQEGFTWDGEWYTEYDDFFITTIDGDSQTADAYWNIAVNGTATPVGGCQFQIDEGDEVAFTWTDM